MASALRQVPGVQTAEVNVATEIAHVRYLPASTHVAALTSAVAAVGYSAAERGDPSDDVDEQTAAHQIEYRNLMRKFWYAASISVVILLVAFPEIRWLDA